MFWYTRTYQNPIPMEALDVEPGFRGVVYVPVEWKIASIFSATKAVLCRLSRPYRLEVSL